MDIQRSKSVFTTGGPQRDRNLQQMNMAESVHPTIERSHVDLIVCICLYLCYVFLFII
jgi:hypothetical protein